MRFNNDSILAGGALLAPGLLLLRLIGNPVHVMQRWINRVGLTGDNAADEDDETPPPVASQLLAYLLVSICGYIVTYRLVPSIKQYTLRKGISGKDLGKKGTSIADKDM